MERRHAGAEHQVRRRRFRVSDRLVVVSAFKEIDSANTAKGTARERDPRVPNDAALEWSDSTRCTWRVDSGGMSTVTMLVSPFHSKHSTRVPLGRAWTRSGSLVVVSWRAPVPLGSFKIHSSGHIIAAKETAAEELCAATKKIDQNFVKAPRKPVFPFEASSRQGLNPLFLVSRRIVCQACDGDEKEARTVQEEPVQM